MGLLTYPCSLRVLEMDCPPLLNETSLLRLPIDPELLDNPLLDLCVWRILSLPVGEIVSANLTASR